MMCNEKEVLEDGWWIVRIEKGQIVESGSTGTLGLVDRMNIINMARDTQYTAKVLEQYLLSLSAVSNLNTYIISTERKNLEPIWRRV